MTQPADALDADAAFALLSNARRRHLLRELRDGRTASLDDVARRVAAAERGVSTGDVDAGARKSVHVSLYQTHVPRLAEHGVVRYDADARTVSLVESSATRRLFRLLDDDDPSSGRRYAAAAAFGAGLLAATALADGGETAWRAVAGLVGLVTAALGVTESGRLRSATGRGPDGGRWDR